MVLSREAGDNTRTRAGQNRPDADVSPLLQAAANGDGGAWGRIVALYGRRLFALAKSRCRDDASAEDITQSVLATVAIKLREGGYTEEGKFESWLFRVAMNRIRDFARRKTRRHEVADPGAMETLTEPDRREREHDPEVALLRSALEKLNDADREIIELRHHGGMSFQQMSDVLDEPLGTLLARHHRALRKLKDLIETARRQEGESKVEARTS